MKKKKPAKKAKVNSELDGLEITITEFGEIKTNYDISNINSFLDRNVKDKKLVEREATLKKKNAGRKKKRKTN